jgi:hypothetical protein
MAEKPYDRTELVARRERRRRAIRRRRIAAAVTVVVALAGIAVTIASTSGDRERTSSRIPGTSVFAPGGGGTASVDSAQLGYASRGKPYELDRFEILRSSGVGGLAADLASG